MKDKVSPNLLGIYIPTRNRSNELRHCIETFIRQISTYGFPIYVSDNASEDGTEKMVKELKTRYRNIFYSRNKENIGYASNVKKVIGMGNTEYLFLFSDDDEIREGTIETILKNIKEGYDFLQLNMSIYNSSSWSFYDCNNLRFH